MMLLETAVALAVLGMVAVALLTGLAGAQRATMLAEGRSVAVSLAQSQMEHLKTVAYVSGAASYTPAAVPSAGDYTGYSVSIAAAPLNVPDDGVQKITVTVARGGQQVLTMYGYKGNR